MLRVGPLDRAWLLVESQATPMHVGCLQIFSSAADTKTLTSTLALLRSHSRLAPPFSLKVDASGLNAFMPGWVELEHADLDHHLRRWTLPEPGGERELGELVSHLQGLELDMSRPLWECHVIDGLADDRYALMIKIHHALMDGIGGTRLLQVALSEDPMARGLPPPWSPHPDAGQPEHLPVPQARWIPRGTLRKLRAQARSLPGVGFAFGKLLGAGLRGTHSALKAPYTAPACIFNQRVSTQRRIATQTLGFEQVRAVAHRSGTTINDVMLCLLAGALRRYLSDLGALPAKPLIAGLPVSIRPPGDMSVGTAVTFMLASLATDQSDPGLRLATIHASTQAAKQHLHKLDKKSLTAYTLLMMAPFITQLAIGLAGRTQPVFNLVISNVPGPRKTLYYNGSRLEAMYPLSISTHGQALNITIMSYQDQLDIGYTACNRNVPHVQRLAVYTREALAELEAAWPNLAKRRKHRNH